MDQTEDFYLVLPSNSSMLFFPENATGCYTTHLPREMRLHGEWRVALAEIHIPCTMMHVYEWDSRYRFQSSGFTEEITFAEGSIPHGIYNSLETLADEINKIKIVSDHQKLQPAEGKKGFYALHRTCECVDTHITGYSQKILRVFGFESEYARNIGSLVTEEKTERIVTGNRPASLARAIVDQLYVYTDICTPYTVGDTQAALLRIVSLDNSKYAFGSNVTKSFAPRHYVPLLHHSFQNIVIDIRDSQGHSIPFEYGTLTATLHFQRLR